VDLKQLDGAAVVALNERVGDARVVVGSDDLEPRRRLACERADVAVAHDPLALRQEARDRVRRLPTHTVAKRPGIRVAVEGDHPIAAKCREGVAQHERRSRLSDPAFTGEDRDAATTIDGRLHARDELALTALGGARSEVDPAVCGAVEQAPQALARGFALAAQHPLR